jgi:hypothetical protein
MVPIKPGKPSSLLTYINPYRRPRIVRQAAHVAVAVEALHMGSERGVYIDLLGETGNSMSGHGTAIPFGPTDTRIYAPVVTVPVLAVEGRGSMAAAYREAH